MIIQANLKSNDNEENTIDNACDIKNNDAVCSVSCSIANSKDLNDLYDKLSSGYSSNIDCEYQNEIAIHSLSGVKDYYHFAIKQREIIPSEVKETSNNFINEILGQYNGKNKMIGNQEVSVSTKMKTGYNTFPKTPTLSTENEIQNANRLMRELQAKEDEGNNVNRSGRKKVSNYKKQFKEPSFNHLNNNDDNDIGSEEVESDKNKNRNIEKSKHTILSSEGYVQTLPNNEENSKKTNSKGA